ncbi:GNAT family N-acetyltransferase [Amycolatopsis sp. FDAARGOS 1241]|uniref:GNAT family N-acetyltransferase n=1 Tax=Amycolatopsis sp. FDAARGOS 1241 TaxID=2778070 RepID=UPI0019528F98|nr:GNAT family N-acetyltransferase [Amycolatopsis sp. FDAARGOS 1241]QRP46810.1 GNAT family N-acetyltransferase [Amycolatopsis sp. FDAARGOS 1241]
MTPELLTEADAGELLTVQRAAYLSEARAHRNFDLPPLVETVEQVRAALADPAWRVWGVRDGGRLIATVRLRVAGAVGEVARLAVAPDRQGEGLGSALLLAAEELAPAEVTRFRLFTGERSAGPLHVYAKLGYRETHRSPEADYQLIHLEKPRGRAPAAIR